jgi:hypothetical protein
VLVSIDFTSTLRSALCRQDLDRQRRPGQKACARSRRPGRSVARDLPPKGGFEEQDFFVGRGVWDKSRRLRQVTMPDPPAAATMQHLDDKSRHHRYLRSILPASFQAASFSSLLASSLLQTPTLMNLGLKSRPPNMNRHHCSWQSLHSRKGSLEDSPGAGDERTALMRMRSK